MYFILCLKGIYLLYKQLDCPGIGDVSPPGDYSAGRYFRIQASLNQQILPPVSCCPLNGHRISKPTCSHHPRIRAQIAGKCNPNFLKIPAKPIHKLALHSHSLRQDQGFSDQRLLEFASCAAACSLSGADSISGMKPKKEIEKLNELYERQELR